MAKKATTYEEQLQILKKRGCVVQDEDFCLKKLAEINYYRLAAYFLPFKQPNDTYRPGTSFEKVYHIYEFDRRLRVTLFSAIEEIEVSFRSQLAYFHAHKYGPTGYLQPANFSTKHDHDKFMKKIDAEVESNRKVLFVKHHIQQYEGIFPVWVISELFTFGMLSYFYADMVTADRKIIATELYHSTPKNVSSWLRCCTDLRNICAHYGRLYYRIFSAIPAGINMPLSAERRLWGAMSAVRSLFPDAEKWNNGILPTLETLFDEYGNYIDLYHIAFPKDWKGKLEMKRSGTCVLTDGI